MALRRQSISGKPVSWIAVSPCVICRLGTQLKLASHIPITPTHAVGVENVDLELSIVIAKA